MNLRSLIKPQDDKIYILPTGHGFVFLIGIVVMILTAATYGNNLIYILAFSLFSVVMVGMVQTHNNLRGVKLKVIHIEESFADNWSHIEVRLEHQLKAVRQSLVVSLNSNEFVNSKPSLLEVLPLQSSAKLDVPVRLLRRGHYDLPRFIIETRFPMGLFRAWKYISVQQKIYIYPSLKGHSALPLRAGFNEEGENQPLSLSPSQDMDFKEHKLHREGESQRHMDWKLAAKRGEFYTKTFEGERNQAYSFDFTQVRFSSDEDKLSQLAQWIHQVFKIDSGFEMILPGKKIELGSGIQHYRASLRELAKYPVKGAS